MIRAALMAAAMVALPVLVPSASAQESAGSGEPAVAEAAEPFRVVRRILVDPGHGGADSGCVGVAGIAEKELTLKTARRLVARLDGRVEWVHLTRDDDGYPTLEDRTHQANLEGADVLLSVHYNCAVNPLAEGIETFYLHPEGTVPGEVVPGREELGESRPVVEYGVGGDVGALIVEDLRRAGATLVSADLAEALQRALVRNTGMMDRGVRQARFRVLRGAHMPAVVAELGFLTNEEEGYELLTSERLNALVDGLVEGLEAYDASLVGRPDAEPPTAGIAADAESD